MKATAFSLPMTERYRGVTEREGVLLQGPAGYGEFSPFWDYADAEAATWLAAAVEAAEHEFPAPVRDRVPVNVTVPAVGPERGAEIVRDSGGCRTAKVKVAEPGQTLDDDLARVAAVRAALGPAGKIRVDANGAWSVEAAVHAVKRLDEFDLEYVEQPAATVEGLAAVRRRVDVPVAADESVRRAADPREVRRAEAADIVVLKVQPLGGVRAALRLADELDLPVVVSSALESSVGLAAGVALAAALPDLPYACGLATAAMLGVDLVPEPLRPVDGCLRVGRIEPLSACLDRARPSAETEARWRARLARCAERLGLAL